MKYVIKGKQNKSYWVYEQAKDGVRPVAKFHNLNDANDYIEMKKITKKFMKDIRSGKIKNTDISF